jgi:hypothetical protein
MKKVIGYGISVAGIVVMVVGFGMVEAPWEFVKTIGSKILVMIGIGAITVGVFIALKFGESKSKKPNRVKSSGENEVPIYEGTGKERKVVGYRKD